MKVNFLICGVQKGGTTALDTYLRAHPEIGMANRKEVHYFDFEKNFPNGKADYSQYHAMFSPQPSNKLIGESTPIYMYWHDAPKRIWQYNPDMKLIAILRNPIDRAYSHWNMEYDRKTDTLPFWEALQSEAQRCREALPYKNRGYSYVVRGFYSEQLRRLWMYFAKEQILVLKNEDLRDQPNETLKKVTGFLGVSSLNNIEYKEVHSRQYSSEMAEREKEYLRSVFEFEIRDLERLLGWDCKSWLE
ncbi:MAG: sulfotransferase domain-containing protein [Gallionella sp.]